MSVRSTATGRQRRRIEEAMRSSRTRAMTPLLRHRAAPAERREEGALYPIAVRPTTLDRER
jgi:hypothetical protein